VDCGLACGQVFDAQRPGRPAVPPLLVAPFTPLVYGVTLARLNPFGLPIAIGSMTAPCDMLIAEKLRALMGSRAPAVPGADRLLGGLVGLGIVTARLETLLATSGAPDFVEKLANQAAAAAQALQEARALATEAQRDRVAAETAWSEASKIKAELEAANAAHVARSAELDSRAHVTEMREVVVTTRERELEKMLHDVAALKAEYESKLAAIEAIVKGPVSST
jgi:hypothetical protein